MKKTLLALAVAGAAVSAQADVKIAGFVAAQIQNNDVDDKTSFSNNGFLQPRIRIESSKQWGDLTVGTNMEFGLPKDQNASNDDEGLEAQEKGINTRRNSFYIKGNFGTVRLGDHNDVGDGLMHVGAAGTFTTNSLSGAGFTHNSDYAGDMGGFDPHRGQGFRYYSPKIAGMATIAAQVQGGGGSEVAIRVNTNGFKLSYYQEDEGTSNVDKKGFLVGYKAPMGLSATYTQSESEDAAGVEDKYDAFQVGYHTGKHKLSILRGTRDKPTSAVDIDTTSFGYEFDATKGVKLYLAYLKSDGLVEVVESATKEEKSIVIGGLVRF